MCSLWSAERTYWQGLDIGFRLERLANLPPEGVGIECVLERLANLPPEGVGIYTISRKKRH
jgi:hypothetical protein